MLFPANGLMPCLKTVSIFFVATMIALPANLNAGLPTDQIRESLNKMVGILENPEFMGPEHLEKKKELIRSAADERIDWNGLSQRCLGRHWRQRTAEEKKIFVSTLTRFLEINYTDIIVDNLGNLADIIYQDESIEGKYALVKIKLVSRSNLETPIFYRMKSMSDGSGWEIIDIVIEGTSMVKIYRTQFNDILRNGTFDELIEKIKTKTAELNH